MNTFISSSVSVFILMRYFNCSLIQVFSAITLELYNFVPHFRETYLSTYSAPSLHGWLMVDALDVRMCPVSDEPITISLLSAVCVVEWIDRSFYAIHPVRSGQWQTFLVNLSTQSICAMDPKARLILTVSRAENFFLQLPTTPQKHVLLAWLVRGKFGTDLSNIYSWTTAVGIHLATLLEDLSKSPIVISAGSFPFKVV